MVDRRQPGALRARWARQVDCRRLVRRIRDRAPGPGAPEAYGAPPQRPGYDTARGTIGRGDLPSVPVRRSSARSHRVARESPSARREAQDRYSLHGPARVPHDCDPATARCGRASNYSHAASQTAACGGPWNAPWRMALCSDARPHLRQGPLRSSRATATSASHAASPSVCSANTPRRCGCAMRTRSRSVYRPPGGTGSRSRGATESARLDGARSETRI